jgi:hypothetical protein
MEAEAAETEPADAEEPAEAVPPHLEFGVADKLQLELDGQALDSIVESYEQLVSRLVLARNDATAEFETLAKRWLNAYGTPPPAHTETGVAEIGTGAAHSAGSTSVGGGGVTSRGAGRSGGGGAPRRAWPSPVVSRAIAGREKAALDSQLDACMSTALAAYARAAQCALGELTAALSERGTRALETLGPGEFVRWSRPLPEVEQGYSEALDAVVRRASAAIERSARFYGLRAPPLDQLENVAFMRKQRAARQIQAHRTTRVRLLRLLRTARALLLFAALNALDAWRRGKWGGPSLLDAPPW